MLTHEPDRSLSVEDALQQRRFGGSKRRHQLAKPKHTAKGETEICDSVRLPQSELRRNFYRMLRNAGVAV
jgi:hypothetical protein